MQALDRMPDQRDAPPELGRFAPMLRRYLRTLGARPDDFGALVAHCAKMPALEQLELVLPTAASPEQFADLARHPTLQKLILMTRFEQDLMRAREDEIQKVVGPGIEVVIP